jgi:P27 family predicted phage terminase small subunit
MGKARHETVARKAMKSLGIYKPEFEGIIKLYGGLRDQYDTLTEMFVASGYKYSEQTQSGTKKAPIVTTLEGLRKDILSYASQLGLTPQGLLRADENAFAKKAESGVENRLGIMEVEP